MSRERLKLTPYLRNWLSLGGLIVLIGSLFAFLLLFAIDFFSAHGTPYLGILTYAVAPGVFVLGVVFGVLGALVDRRHLRRSSPTSLPHVPQIVLSRPRDRRVRAGLIAGAVGFLLLTAIASNRTYHYSES